MSINQKGFTNIILVIVVIVLIGIAGYFIFVKKSEPIAQQPTPIDETASWKTYTNSEQGFEFKYPAICKTSSNDMVGGVQLSVDINSANDNCNFSVVYYDNLDAISIGVDVPRKSVYDFAKDPSLSSTQKIIFHGNDALSGVFENKYISLQEKEIYVSHNGHLYEISYTIVYDKQIFKTDIPEKIIS